MQEDLLRFQKNKTFTYIDFETLNLCLSFSHNLPWEVGMLRVVDDRIVKSHEILVKWDTGLKISAEAAEMTRYDHNKILKKGIDEAEAFGIMYGEIESADYVMGHNTLGFDIYLIYEWYKKHKKDPRGLVRKFIDTNCLAKAVKYPLNKNENESILSFQYRAMQVRLPKGEKTKLGILGKEYGVEHDYESLHSAIPDLELNKKVWDKLKFKLDI